MKIGIISSWVDTLALFQVLTRYDHEYLICCDQDGFPYWEKSVDSVLDRINMLWKFLISKGADIIIVDPIYELACKHIGNWIWFEVLPLFQKYLKDFVFKYSLVGKIWIFSDFWSFWKVQWLFENEEKDYHLTDEQKLIKKFNYPFHYRVKSVSSWIANINDLWVHNPFLIRTMKNDLRYFKDAYVDTVVPMHYSYFRMQRTIKSFFNFHKTRFHDLSALEKCFNWLVDNEVWWKYNVEIWINQPSDFLSRNRQLMWLIKRWNSINVNVEIF